MIVKAIHESCPIDADRKTSSIPLIVCESELDIKAENSVKIENEPFVDESETIYVQPLSILEEPQPQPDEELLEQDKIDIAKARKRTKQPKVSAEKGKKSDSVRKATVSKEKSERMHMCEVCGKGFKHPSGLAQHALTHLDRKLTKVQCDVCGKWIKNRNVLRAHMLMHNQTPKKCPHCDKIKQTVRALQAHISLAHSAPTHPCTFCDKSFTRAKALREHIATHTGEQLYTCAYCSKKFKSSPNKYMHMRKHHLEQWNLDRAKRINSM